MGGSERGKVGGQHTTSRQGLVAVAVVLVVTVLGTLWVLSYDPFEGDRPVAPEPGQSGAPGTAPAVPSTPEESTTSLDGAATTGRCLPPSADRLADVDVAVDAVVESVDGADGGATVTLRPTRFFTGDETDTVEVTALDGDLLPLIGSVEFVEGDRFLVAGTDGAVAVCGLSGPWSPRLDRLYEQALG